VNTAELRQRHQPIGESGMHAHREKTHRDLSSSVPPVLDTCHDRAPVSLEWQTGLPEEESRTPAHPSQHAEGNADAAGGEGPPVAVRAAQGKSR